MVSVYETASTESRESQVMAGDSHESLRWSSFSQRLMFVLAALSQIVFVCSTAAEFTEQKASLMCFTSCHGTVLLWRHNLFALIYNIYNKYQVTRAKLFTSIFLLTFINTCFCI